MGDFTYAGLVALLARVIFDHDQALLEGTTVADPMKGAMADADNKQSLVQRVMDRHGPGLLLSTGQYLDLADETPALTVLKNSATPRVLAEKFMRLERYHHSAHRTLIETQKGRWICARYGKGQLSTDGENCLIAGLLLGLAMTIGRKEPRLEIGGRLLTPEGLHCATLEPGAATAQFRISWSSPATPKDQRRSPAPKYDKGRLSDRLAALFETDIGRSWSVADTAQILAASERSLQRRLNAEARSYSSVLRRARMKAATMLLVETDTSLAEIGYCCGYADQAHFQRDFLRTANVTPRQFRLINREADGLI